MPDQVGHRDRQRQRPRPRQHVVGDDRSHEHVGRAGVEAQRGDGAGQVGGGRGRWERDVDHRRRAAGFGRAHEEPALRARAVDRDAFRFARRCPDRDVEQRAVEHDAHGPGVQVETRLAGEIGGDDRTEERNIGRGAPQLPRHDRHLHPGGERAVVLARPPQVEPAGRVGRLGQPCLPGGVVEIGHGAGAEIGEQGGGRRPQRELLVRVPGVHPYALPPTARLRSTSFSTFPAAFTGSSVTISTARGTL